MANKGATALIDSGSSISFIHPSLLEACSLVVFPSKETISMATKTFTDSVQEHCTAGIEINNRVYPAVKLHVSRELCSYIILGQDWQARNESVTICIGKKTPVMQLDHP